MCTAVHRFESQDSQQTLEQGIAEYLSVNAGLKRDADLLWPQAQRFFRNHDVVHVLYGCGTSMSDEAVVKLASLLGTTGGCEVIRGYIHQETVDIYRHLPVAGTALALITAPYLIARTAWRCLRQSQRWPWDDHEPFMQVPLAELRRQFGIKVTH